MTWHPTTNRVQYGLLTTEERNALVAWPHGWDLITPEDVRLHRGNKPCWNYDSVYRGKPAPVVTSWWLNVYGGGVSFRYESRSEADSNTLPKRIDVLRIDTCNGVSTAHLEGLKDE
jgi:hypothetical protein